MSRRPPAASAIVGGMAEYVSLVTGYRFLLVVVGVLYALAFVVTPRRSPASSR